MLFRSGSHLQLDGVRGAKFLVRQGNRCRIDIWFFVLHAQFPTKGQNLALAQRAGIFLCVFWLEEQGAVLQEQFSFFLVLDTAQAMQTGLCALHRIVDTLKALGLTKMNKSIEKVNNEFIQGMINTVGHLVKVEESK